MYNTIEAKLRKTTCKKLNNSKKYNKKLTTLLKNKDKTNDIIYNNLYSFISKDWIAPCSSELHLQTAVYELIEKLSPDDSLFKDLNVEQSIVTQSITERYLLGLDIPQHLQKYIAVEYLK